MWHQSVGRDAAEPARFEVFDGLTHLGACVHDEGPVVLDMLSDGLTPKEQHFKVLLARVQPVGAPQGETLARTED